MCHLQFQELGPASKGQHVDSSYDDRLPDLVRSGLLQVPWPDGVFVHYDLPAGQCNIIHNGSPQCPRRCDDNAGC